MNANTKMRVLRQIHLAAEGGKLFRVKFKRRTPPVGEIREMTCKLGAKNRVKGVLEEGIRASEDWRNDTLTVFEMCGKESHFKRIPLDSLISINGKEV